MRVPKALEKVYRKGRKLISEKNPDVQKLQRWLSIMDDVREYEKHQEEYDRTLGKDLREFLTLLTSEKNRNNIVEKENWSSLCAVTNLHRRPLGHSRFVIGEPQSEGG